MERRRCLLLVYRLPWPPEAGGSLRDWQNISVLSEWTDLSVVALRSHPRELPPKRVALWTTLDAERLREPAPFDGSEVVLERDWWRNELGYPTDHHWSPFRAAALRQLLKTSDFDFVVIEDVVFWRYAEIVREFAPILIDYHNVQSRIGEKCLAFVRDCDAEERKRAALALQTMRSVEEMYRELPAVVCSEGERRARPAWICAREHRRRQQYCRRWR